MECQLNGGDGESTKNFRYLRWRDSWTLWVATLGGGKVFPYRSRIHTAYIDEDSSILGSNKMFGEKRRQKHSLKLYAGLNYHFEPPKIGGLSVVSNIFDFHPDPLGKITPIWLIDIFQVGENPPTRGVVCWDFLGFETKGLETRGFFFGGGECNVLICFILTHDGSMQLVNLPIFTIKINHSCR